MQLDTSATQVLDFGDSGWPEGSRPIPYIHAVLLADSGVVILSMVNEMEILDKDRNRWSC